MIEGHQALILGMVGGYKKLQNHRVLFEKELGKTRDQGTENSFFSTLVKDVSDMHPCPLKYRRLP